MSTDRTLRENAFHSYYKSYREHINTFAASYAGAIKAATAEAAKTADSLWSSNGASIFPPCTAMSACAKRCWALTRCTSMTSTLRWSAI